MKIEFHDQFLKHFKKRINPNKKLSKIYDRKLKLWIENRNNPVTKDHALTGEMREYRAFWITGGIRVSYKITQDTLLFMDVGSHDQVYNH